MPATSTKPSAGQRNSSMWRSESRRDQIFLGVISLALLGASALMQNMLSSRRTGWNLVREAPESEKTYRSIAMNFPRLTLGGFRGIISAVLWQQAEDDKNERRWMDLETKYDIIGALQPYFVSVYTFHAWNMAYNLSAQWQEQDTKYKWVLDGQAYLYKGEDYNPGRPELYLEEGHMYMLKLGGAYERIFYRAHWRDDISRLYQLNDSNSAATDATVALKHVRAFVNHHDPRDGNNYFRITEMPNPDTTGAPGTGWGIQITDPVLFADRTDGKGPGDPMEFRYGLSPYYFAFREYNRCIETNGGTVTGVIDAFPAMCLRLWCRDDLYYTYDTMKTMFRDSSSPLLENSTVLNAKVSEIHDCYRNVQIIAPRAVALFNEHLGRFPANIYIHTKHILEAQAYVAISKAETKLFDALIRWHLNGRKLTPEVIALFQEADHLYQQAFPLTMKWVDNMYPVVVGQPPDPNRADSERYATALQTRSKGIQDLLTLPPNQKPDMSFLEDEVVEK